MERVINARVSGIFANNKSRIAWARLIEFQQNPPGSWYQIESTHYDCVTNMLTVLATDKIYKDTYPGHVNLKVDDNDKIIEVNAWASEVTQEQAKNLMMESQKANSDLRQDSKAESIKERVIMATVDGLTAINKSRTASAWLRETGSNPPAGGQFQIESTNHDCVTNMLTVLANAKSTKVEVEVRLDDKNNIIGVVAATEKMTEEEFKRLMDSSTK